MSKRNIRLLIAFDGTHFKGWQRQNGFPTIQETLEDNLAVITNSPVTLHGAGRTDAGVHAAGMVANFLTPSAIPCDGLRDGLNSMLPKDIRILGADEPGDDFHSRFSAAGKTYCYNFFTGKVQMPMERLYTAHCKGLFNPEPVSRALEHIRGTHDFSSFEAVGSRDPEVRAERGAVRTIYRAQLEAYQNRADAWKFTFTGNGFLRHMVRNLVGTLMQVGSGRITPDRFREVVENKDRKQAGPTAPAHGLTLEKVHYDRLSELRL